MHVVLPLHPHPCQGKERRQNFAGLKEMEGFDCSGHNEGFLNERKNTVAELLSHR